jgi:Zn ribbon nucleic-acid-binding protein
MCICVCIWKITTKWENNIKAVECEGCGWIQLAEDRAHVCEHGNEIFGSINTGNL